MITLRKKYEMNLKKLDLNLKLKKIAFNLKSYHKILEKDSYMKSMAKKWATLRAHLWRHR